MALKIRLRQQGRKNQQMYRLVLCDSRSPRDGKYIETLGWYNPYETEADKNLNIQADRVEHWLDLGAVLSENAEALVKRGAPKMLATFNQKKMEAKARLSQKKKAARKNKELANA